MNWNGVFVFLLGFVCCVVLVFGFGSSFEVPLGTGFDVFSEEVSAPSDYVLEENIVVLQDEIILKIKGASLSSYAETGSMVPVLDKGANGIRVVPESEDDVQVGDIVSFRMGGVLVVHRVVAKGEDDDGFWFDVKGDANLVGDGRIRFKDIEYKTIGVIY